MILKVKPFDRLYIHIPFCASKCAYCTFYSEPDASLELINAYLGKLEIDMKEQSGLCNPLKSIYIGGGTPTYLSEKELETFFNMISKNFRIEANAEISIECNPESLTNEKALILSSFANRVSVGVQSFQEKFRKILGRRRSIKSVYHAFNILQKTTINNLGLDLIYAIPEQSLSNWESELQSALDINISHISAYSLTIEEGSHLAKKDINEVEYNEISSEMWKFTGNVLEETGLTRYEISNYAKPGFECQHNLDIWFGDTYLGLGPAASSFNGKTRWTQECNLKKWLNSQPPIIDDLPDLDRAKEIFIMGLRTVSGWNPKKFYEKTGIYYNLWQTNIEVLIQENLLEISDSCVKATKKGLLFWDEIAMEMI